MKSASAYILYDPLSVSIFMETVAGSLNQRQIAGGGFDPDRTLTPLVLRPRLKITDPDNTMQSGDYTSTLIDCKWYIGSDSNGTLILSTNTDYTLGANGELTVRKNVSPSTPLSLFFSCAFIDPRSQKTFRKEFLVTLTSILSTEVNLQLEVDAAKKMPINPFKTHAQRTITATFRNGATPVQDAQATYTWKVLDDAAGGGKAYRAITNDDLFYVSGQGTKQLTIDRRFIDKELIQLEAYITAIPAQKATTTIKAFRWYGQWEENEMITRGKFVRPDTTEIEVLATVTSPKGEIPEPQKFFDMTHYLTTNDITAPRKAIGYGQRVVVPATIVGKDPNVIPVFMIDAKELTALRPCTIGGKIATINGKIMCIQIPKD